MSINRDSKILEAILFASGSPVLEEDLNEHIKLYDQLHIHRL